MSACRRFTDSCTARRNTLKRAIQRSEKGADGRNYTEVAVERLSDVDAKPTKCSVFSRFTSTEETPNTIQHNPASKNVLQQTDGVRTTCIKAQAHATLAKATVHLKASFSLTVSGPDFTPELEEVLINVHMIHFESAYASGFSSVSLELCVQPDAVPSFYVNRLPFNTQAAKCDSSAQLEDQLRARFIANIQLPELQQKLLLYPDKKIFKLFGKYNYTPTYTVATLYTDSIDTIFELYELCIHTHNSGHIPSGSHRVQGAQMEHCSITHHAMVSIGVVGRDRPIGRRQSVIHISNSTTASCCVGRLLDRCLRVSGGYVPRLTDKMTPL
ncbi:hypothetical protein T265_00181 [Opisthorchis viverrini]|uniref:Uncharacterized protein n=1 Tax=Opisthorchis viverrini TaxID=6198 RepID=A0A075AJU1_OPIVI|nr:hypothetical protein T265_00181 [Opisthorchis viverrini]KER33974.1 hypothetical protein T265_00181 [Opisthorchis viverrini]